MNVSHSQIGKCFNHTANYLDRHGWTQGEAQDIRGGMCAQAALMTVASMENIEPELAVRIMVNALHTFIPHWNDSICKTKEEVTSVFRAQAVIHLAQEGDVPVSETDFSQEFFYQCTPKKNNYSWELKPPKSEPQYDSKEYCVSKFVKFNWSPPTHPFPDFSNVKCLMQTPEQVQLESEPA